MREPQNSVPMTMSYNGYHQSTMSQLRYQAQPSGAESTTSAHQHASTNPATWKQRLGALRSSLDAVSPQKTSSQGPQGRYHISRLSARELGAYNVTASEYHSLHTRQAQGGTQRFITATHQHPAEQQGTSGHLVSSRLLVTGPVLATTSFEAIAAACVGGGMLSMQRPHTQFTAARGGNGLAIFERLPRSQDNRHKLNTAKRQQQQQHQYREGSPSTSLARPARDGTGTAPSSPTRTRLPRRSSLPAQAQIFPLPDPPLFRRPFTTGVIQPMVEPQQHSPWFQPRQVCATFLSGPIPNLPLPLRVDCGSITERDFLMSGMHAKHAQNANAYLNSPMGLARQSAGEPFSTAAANPFSPNQQHQLDELQGNTPRSFIGFPNTEPSSPNLRAAGALQRNSSPPGFRTVKTGVWRPDTAASDAAILSRISAQGPGEALLTPGTVVGSPGEAQGFQRGQVVAAPAVNILQAIKDVHKPQSIRTEAFQFATDCRIGVLPREDNLPRRQVPAIGK